MLRDSRLVSLIVYANDPEASRSFYERQLGLPLIDASRGSARLDAGGIKLQVEPALEHGVWLAGRRDDSSDIVFLVDDLEAVRADLEGRGVEFIRRRSYEVGAVTDFYDPSGHRLMLYQPSEVALTWPSADKIRDVWRAYGLGASDLIGPAAGPDPRVERSGQGGGLLGKPLIYLFMFENDAASAFDFYGRALELQVAERVHCCNSTCPEEIEGIVKYDVGDVLLSTHHLHEASGVVDDYGQAYSPREYRPEHARGIAPIFEVADIRTYVAGLAERGITFHCGIEESEGGRVSRFEDPFGHPFFLQEARRAVAGPARAAPGQAGVPTLAQRVSRA